MPMARDRHILNVRLDPNDLLKGYTSPDSAGVGHSWHLQIRAIESTGLLGVYLHASGMEEACGRREDVKCGFQIIRLTNIKRSTGTGGQLFRSSSSGFEIGKLSLDIIRNPAEGYIDSTHCYNILLDLEAPQARGTKRSFDSMATNVAEAPPASLSGNALLILDDKRSLHAHSVYLEQASEVFQFALECSQPLAGSPAPEQAASRPGSAGSPHVTHQLPLTGVSKHQALLLLHCLYVWQRESWVQSLSLDDLCDLACIANKFGCDSVLELVDATMLARCVAQQEVPADADHGAPILTVASAPKQHRRARELNLRGYSAHIEFFMGLHASEIDLALVHADYVGVLRGACKMRAEVFASLLGR